MLCSMRVTGALPLKSKPTFILWLETHAHQKTQNLLLSRYEVNILNIDFKRHIVFYELGTYHGLQRCRSSRQITKYLQ